MEKKENYYLLLDLSFDPPEVDPKVIVAAMKKKQAAWSRMRNHPVKGIMAKQYIGLIPDIKKIMTDKVLRKKEAVAAKEIFNEQQQKKFKGLEQHARLLAARGSISDQNIDELAKLQDLKTKEVSEWLNNNNKIIDVDRQIEVLMRKGSFGTGEITKLAKKNEIRDEKIRELVNSKREHKFKIIDAYLDIQNRCGGVTLDAIKRLAGIFYLKAEELEKRFKGQVRKNRKKDDIPSPLDHTIEKLINNNLEIVGKSTLYEFLELVPSSNIDTLQGRAKKKDGEIRKLGKQDAATTAAGALAGHCIAIFKTDQSRNSYDQSLIYSYLPKLDVNITMGGMDGKISFEAYIHLVRSAIELGMDPEEAEIYVTGKCREHKWDIELDPRKKRFRILVAVSVISAVILIITAFISVKLAYSYYISKQYHKTQLTATSKKKLEAKQKEYKRFSNKYPGSEYAEEVSKKIKKLQHEIESRDYKVLNDKIIALYQHKNLDQAKKEYMLYQKKYPRNKNSAKIKTITDELSKRIDDRDYQNVISRMQGDYPARIKLYLDYVSKHSKSKNSPRIHELAKKTIEEYYQVLQKRFQKYEQEERWQESVQICKIFIKNYADHKRSENMQGQLQKYEKKLRNQKDLIKLKQKADQYSLDLDFTGAQATYKVYVKTNPEMSSYMRKLISKEIKTINQKHQEYKQQTNEWEELREYCTNTKLGINDRLAKMETYVQNNPQGYYINEAKPILEVLQDSQKEYDADTRRENAEKAWREIVIYSKNANISLSSKVKRMENYIRANQNSLYLKDAKAIFKKLQQLKAREDQLIQANRDEKARISSATAKVRAMLKNTRGRFVEGSPGVVIDQTTGLSWCMIDSKVVYNRCIDYRSAHQYVANLRTGGHRWRLPTKDELIKIFKTRPFFPSLSTQWYWSSDIVSKGWNKKVICVDSGKETAWKKQERSGEQCGVVRAVKR